MQNENRQNPETLSNPELGTAKAAEKAGGSPAGSQEAPQIYLRLKQLIQQTHSDAERARVLAEQNREDIKYLKLDMDAYGRKTSRTGWVAALLVIVLLGAGAYGYFALQGNQALLAQFPAIQTALNGVGQRMNAAEEKLRDWSSNWDGMSARVSKIEKGAGTNLRVAKDYATEQAAKVHHELQAEMDNRTRSTDAAVSRLQSTHEEDQKQIASLQQEIAIARRQSGDQIARAQQETGREMGNLRGEVNRSRDDFDAMARNLAQRRLDFELSKEQTREVAPGITVTLSNTNVSYQRVEGRILLVPDGRILWIRGQGIQQPVRFYSHQEKRPYELVFTRVSKDSAVGYVLMPASSNAEVSATASQAIESDSGMAANSAPVATGRP